MAGFYAKCGSRMIFFVVAAYVVYQKKGKRHIQERAAQATDETVGLMKLHRPPITEERRTQSVCVVEEGEHRM